MAFVPASEGDALRQCTLELIEPLRPLCEQVVLLDADDPAWSRAYEGPTGHPIWFVIAPFGEGEFQVENNRARSPWFDAGIPFIRLFGDAPAYFPAKHVQYVANSINAYAHPEHHELFGRRFGAKAPSIALRLFPFDRVAKHEVDFERKAASGTILFPKNGNCADRLARYWREKLPPSVSRALESVAESLCADLDRPVDLAAEVQNYFAGLGIGLPEDQRLTFFLVAQLDDYLRRRKSTLIARALLDYPVVIRGVNWDHVDFSGKRARYDPDSDYVRTRPLFDTSLAIIDMSPNTHRSAHDRVLRAAGRYTTFLTNRQQFYVDSFPDHDAFTFLFTPDAVCECVEAALSRPRDTVEMGIAQAERMREVLTRETYIDQVLTAVDACALSCGKRPPGTQNFVSFESI